MASASLPRIARRILFWLERAEWREPNPHFQDDYRIAWITVLRSARGERIPHVSATYAVVGLHPDKVWPAIVERRKSLLGAAYESWYGVKLPPKKPSQSVTLPRLARIARAA
jgi:hypothetical protein